MDASVIEMGKLLYEVKGGGQGQAIAKSEISAAADAILQPLMDLLDGKQSNQFIEICGQTFMMALVTFTQGRIMWLKRLLE